MCWMVSNQKRGVILRENKNKCYEHLIESCENLAETSDFISKYGVDLVVSDDNVLSGYDLIVKYYAGILTSLGLVLDDLGVSIPNERLKKEMIQKLKEIKNGKD